MVLTIETGVPIDEVAVAHFTFCQKPWTCNVHTGQPMCKDMHKAWWQVRAELEEQLGTPVTSTERCPGGQYKKLRPISENDGREEATLPKDCNAAVPMPVKRIAAPLSFVAVLIEPRYQHPEFLRTLDHFLFALPESVPVHAWTNKSGLRAA